MCSSDLAYGDELTDASVTVVGHTDRSGSSEYNDRLAQIRADLVADALRDRGFDSGSIEVQQSRSEEHTSELQSH